MWPHFSGPSASPARTARPRPAPPTALLGATGSPHRLATVKGPGAAPRHVWQHLQLALRRTQQSVLVVSCSTFMPALLLWKVGDAFAEYLDATDATVFHLFK